ncbi:MAG TPA: DEAD/DEAH box helicase family protein [Kofleriaceae bacterium]
MRVQFDRGTLVISGIETGFLDGAVWDPELRAHRLPAARLSELRVRLSDNGVRISDISDNIRPIPPPRSLPELRWYQRAALDAWHATRRGVIALPTGSGKTIVAIGAIAMLGVASLIVVPTRILVDQWARVLGEVFAGPIGRLGDGDRQIERITVATYASALAWAPQIGDQFGLVVVDEAHHVGGWLPADMFEMLVADARLGLTATPDRPSESRSDGWYETAIGPVVYALGVADLVGTALADYELETVPIDLSVTERAAYRTSRGHFNEAYRRFKRLNRNGGWSEFVQQAVGTPEGRAALAAWRASRALLSYPDAKRTAVHEILAKHSGERTLVFTADNATAYAIARDLLVPPITCDIRRAERAERLRQFRAGTAPVLVSAQVLDEGFDVPEADVAIIVGGSSSKRRYVQRIGRVLRPRAGKCARIYELTTQEAVEIRQVSRRREAIEEAQVLS